MIRRPLRTCGLGSRVLSCEMLSRPGHDTLRGLGGTSFLPSDEQNRPSDFTAKRQSTEINDFLGASTLRTPSSGTWKIVFMHSTRVPPQQSHSK